MNTGLAQGFVRFGSVAHLILLHLAVNEDTCQVYLCDGLDLPPENAARMISVTLSRLVKYKFIYQTGKKSILKTGVRTQMFFSLTSRSDPRNARRLTGAVRSARYRDRQKLKAPSVFNFRGSIQL